MNKKKHILKDKLTLEDFVYLCQNKVQIELGRKARQKVKEGVRKLEELKKKKKFYGFNRGIGALVNQSIPGNQLDQFQKNLIRSHACGVGKPLGENIVRGVMLLLINSLSKGFSGVRLEVIETLIRLFNKNVIPFIPEKGSVGASGDLVPLSHLALVLIGEGEAFYRNKRYRGKEVLTKAGLQKIELKPKEGLALMNGTHLMTSVAAFCVFGAENLMKTADIASAMSLEALYGTDRNLDFCIHRLKPYPGQLDSARNLQKLVKGSQIILSHRNCSRIQDVYSLRCTPQVHGASRDAISYARKAVETEMNSVTDNPLIFSRNKVLSCGNFHGQAIGLALDFLGIALAELADISEKRIEQLLNSDVDKLPPFLVKQGGLNSGFMVSQYTAASLVSQNKILSHPASVDSIPTSANKEDHVSMATIAAQKALEILYNSENVIAIELLCAAQALDFHLPLEPGQGVKKAYQIIRKKVSYLREDRILYKDIEMIYNLGENGSLLKEVEGTIGKLK